MELLNRYRSYITREKNNGNIKEHDGEVMRILDLHNRNKKNMPKKYKNYMDFSWKEFKEEVLKSVKTQPKVIHSDNMCYVIQYGRNDFKEYKKRYDNKTRWCTTVDEFYGEYIGNGNLYVLHNVHNGLLYQTNPTIGEDIYWNTMADKRLDPGMSTWLTNIVLPSLIKVDHIVRYQYLENKDNYIRYPNKHPVWDQWHNGQHTCTYNDYIANCYYAGLIESRLNDIERADEYYITKHNVMDILGMKHITYELIVEALKTFPDIRKDITDEICCNREAYKFINRLIEEGHMGKEELTYMSLKTLHELGIYDVLYYTMNPEIDEPEFSSHKQDMIVLLRLNPLYEKYYPNHPDYNAIMEGRYSDIKRKDILIHFNKNVRYPEHMIKDAEYVQVCDDLPEDYAHMLIDLGKYKPTSGPYVDYYESSVQYMKDDESMMFEKDPFTLTDRELDYIRDHKLHHKLKINRYNDLIKSNHRIIMDIMSCSYDPLELVTIFDHNYSMF